LCHSAGTMKKKNNEESHNVTDTPDNLPSVNDILFYVEKLSRPVGKNDIARHFKVKGNDRIGLKQRLKEMTERGQLGAGKGRTVYIPASLPPIGFIIIEDIDSNGELTARPEKWPLKDGDKGERPTIFVMPDKKGRVTPERGDRILAKLKKINSGEYEARPIKKMEKIGKDKDDFLAFVSIHKDEFRLYPTDKRIRQTYRVIAKNAVAGVKSGDLVMARPLSGIQAEIVEIVGHQNDPNIISLISIHALGIPTKFSHETIEETKDMSVPELGKREDLRSVALVTIDGADSRDFDDAVFAEEDTDPNNEGGWHLIVGIADVSYYVRPNSALDDDAYERGNSCYFPDRVVPMLPEKLSNDLCSLVPHQPRACMACHMWIDHNGNLIRKKITRALMQSHARLTYNQVEHALFHGEPDETTAPLLDPTLKNLKRAFKILLRAREKRGTLDLHIPERQVTIEDGKITAIRPREDLQSHKLIEEFMVLANVAVAEALEEKKAPCIYRIHPEPDAARLASTRSFLKEMGFTLEGGSNTQPAHLNRLLTQTAGSPQAPLINEMVLRSQSQALYSPDNVGHFGLALDKYAHFTSPIRRYADLVVHRSLVKAFGLGEGGLSDDEAQKLDVTADHISNTERRAVMAERESLSRYVSAFLSDRLGATFPGMITGVNSHGVFVRLDETGAEGFVPIRTLPNDYYVHDEARHALVGKDTRRIYRLSAPLTVRLIEASGQTGSLILEVVGDFGADILESHQIRGISRGHGRSHKGGERKSSNTPQREKITMKSRKKGPKNRKNKGKRTKPY